MMTLTGVRKVLFATPVLFAAAALVLPSKNVQAAPSPDVTTAVIADVAADVIVDVATNVAGQLVEEAVDVSADGDMLLISNCTYYNNANHTQIVGQFGYDCCNNPVAWGRKSQFYTCGGCFPCIPPPR
jgi:hypothetical protein